MPELPDELGFMEILRDSYAEHGDEIFPIRGRDIATMLDQVISMGQMLASISATTAELLDLLQDKT